ncbi:hypothetical protein ABK040_002014 [Willaertia magna]
MSSELERLENLLQDNKKPSTTLYIDIIKEICEKSNVRRPDLVVKCGKKLLFDSHYKYEAKSILGDSVWNFYEYLLRNALDLNQIDLAQQCLIILQDKFGSGLRVQRLEGLVMEGTEAYEEALSIYDDIIESNPTDQISYKRKVAIYKALNDNIKAIQTLNQYLQIYQNDSDAYEELFDLYLILSEYKSALFCIEELILQNPKNYIYHLKCADVHYTLGDYKVARKYYSQSLNLKPENNNRALFGLYLTCKSLPNNTNDKLNKELSSLTQERIIKSYTKVNNNELAILMKDIFLQDSSTTNKEE